MEKLQFEGTLRSVQTTDRRKKDLRIRKGKLVIMNEEGDRIDVTGKEAIIDGYNPEDQVIVTISRANKTIAESTGKKKKSDPPKVK